MANRIYVVCRGPRPIAYEEIVEQVADMGFLDERPRFDPPASATNESNTDWGAFEVHYRDGAEPITVEQLVGATELAMHVGELRDKLANEPATPIRDELMGELQAAVRALLFELPDSLPEDVWEMLDATEGYFAEVCDGVIVAHEGIFDRDLRLVLRWTNPGI